MARAVGAAGVGALLGANMDYLVDAVCSRLARLPEHPATPAVVECIARHAQGAAFPLLEVRDPTTCARGGRRARARRTS